MPPAENERNPEAVDRDDSSRVILIRFGEIGLKGKNRPDFEKRLFERIKNGLKPLEGARVERSHGRFFVSGLGDSGETEEAIRLLQRVFGIVSMSPALRVKSELETIKGAALAVAREELSRLRRAAPNSDVPVSAAPVRFKVQARRANKGFSYGSLELNQIIGAHVLRNAPNLKADMHEPEFTLHVEVREETYLYASVIPGPGGLPVGSSGRGVVLLSGGIDSPVAAWMTMKRGVEIRAVHFFSFPFTGERSKQKVVDLCRVLSTWCDRLPLDVVPFTDIQKAIYEEAPEPLRVIVMRRMMLRIAESIAAACGAGALVTGESLGQVASQTLESLHVIGAVATLPVLRPLIGMDKTEIIELANRIGTYPVSILPYEDCCSVFVPRHPRTKPRLEETVKAEERLEVDRLVRTAVAGIERRFFARGQETVPETG